MRNIKVILVGFALDDLLQYVSEVLCLFRACFSYVLQRQRQRQRSRCRRYTHIILAISKAV